MSLLDGKYEIISQHPVSDHQTLFEATASDGTLVQILWYELTPDQEALFEHYRRTLKQLKRSGQAAVYDVVSRPGASYVAWETPQGPSVQPREPALLETLQTLGYAPQHADVRRTGRQEKIYGLAFGEVAPVHRSSTNADPSIPTVHAKPRRKPYTPATWVISWSLASLLGLTAVGLFLLGFKLRSNDELVSLPDLINQDINAAVQILHDLSLEVELTPRSSTEPIGAVLQMEPGSGSLLRPGRSVRLSYALPPGQLTPTPVPQLVGLLFPNEVETSLKTAGLELGRVSRIAAETPAGMVISQAIVAGKMIEPNRPIDVLISTGPVGERTFLPDLVGLPREDAQFLARVAGLSPDRILEETVPATSRSAGQVVAQSLTPYVPVSLEDATLRLLVAEPSSIQQTEPGLPSFIGMTEEQALGYASSYRLSFQSVQEATLPEGIIGQSPAPGSPETDGELVLIINVHPLIIPVPEIQAQVREAAPRDVPYAWFIEPGIPDQLAEVFATTLEGETTLVESQQVRGGDLLEGHWLTHYPGPVTFTITLNGAPYAELFVP
ncbi:MAG: PASTA domain-containing protein [Trueperaceae bacterium]|nr:MAG: PASTA domain-containing protein [Trueperaceae bacterium]